MIFEPRWKSYIVQTNQPIFTPQQCDQIIRLGQGEKQLPAKVGTSTQTDEEQDPTKLQNTGVDDKSKRITTISWIPFNRPDTQPMYKQIDRWVKNININQNRIELDINESRWLT